MERRPALRLRIFDRRHRTKARTRITLSLLRLRDYSSDLPAHQIKPFVMFVWVQNRNNIKIPKELSIKVPYKTGIYESKLCTPYLNLLSLWQKCGFTKSFQQIIADSGWENIKVCDHEGEMTHTEEQLKDKNARNLAEFLLEI